MKLFRKITYPRVVEFENGKFGVEVGRGVYADKENQSYYWEIKFPHLVSKYCLVDTVDEAISMVEKRELIIKRQVYP